MEYQLQVMYVNQAIAPVLTPVITRSLDCAIHAAVALCEFGDVQSVSVIDANRMEWARFNMLWSAREYEEEMPRIDQR